MMLSNDEKRKFKRINFREPVQLCEKDLMHTRGTLSCDLSEGGVRVVTNDFIPLDMEFIVTIPMHREGYIECPAKVVWINELRYSERFQAGIMFHEDHTFTPIKKQLRELIAGTPADLHKV